MPKLSEIKVYYRRSMQPRQYESAEASASLTYIVAEGEEFDVDDVLSDELDRVQAQVEATLNTTKPAPAKTEKKPNPTKPAAAPKATPAPGAPASTPASGTKPPSGTGTTATTPASPSKPAAPKAPAKPAAPKPAPAAKTEEDAPAVTKGDMMKAISTTLTALQKKGITDGPAQIEKKVRAYLQDDKPPYSYSRIPENSWRDFIKDVEALKNG